MALTDVLFFRWSCSVVSWDSPICKFLWVSYFRPVVHNIWVMTPTGVAYQIPFITDILRIRYLHCNL